MAPSAPESSGRFLTLTDVAAELNISQAQAYALVRNRELRAIKIGGRGQWRVARIDLEDYITGAYKTADTHISAHPFDERNASGDENEG